MTHQPAARSRWLMPIGHHRAAAVRLLCFPHAGGGASMFQPWTRVLPPNVAIYGIQMPGRENRLREPPGRALGEILEAVAEAMSALDDRPFVLFGHSMGALLAFELTRALRRAGRPGPSALVVSGRPAPHIPGRAPRLAHLPPAEIVRRIAERYGGIPAVVLDEPELVEMMGTALQADLSIVEGYAYEPDAPLSCPISAFGGRDDVWATRDELDAWSEHTRGGFASAQFGGDHFYLRTPEPLLARVREACLTAGAR